MKKGLKIALIAAGMFAIGAYIAHIITVEANDDKEYEDDDDEFEFDDKDLFIDHCE